MHKSQTQINKPLMSFNSPPKKSRENVSFIKYNKYKQKLFNEFFFQSAKLVSHDIENKAIKKF